MQPYHPYQNQYAGVAEKLLNNPKKKGGSRLGAMHSDFAVQFKIDLQKEFPLQDVKTMKMDHIINELLWMLSGSTNVRDLDANNCKIWNDDAFRYYKEKYQQHDLNQIKDAMLMIDEDKEKYEKSLKSDWTRRMRAGEYFDIWLNPKVSREHYYGDLDLIYGHQWRSFSGQVDQIQNVIDKLRTNPDDRRMIVTAWNPSDIEKGNVGLPACHTGFQVYSTEMTDQENYELWMDLGKPKLKTIPIRKLSLHVTLRSNDFFLGNPYNVAQYALMTHILANLTNHVVDELSVLSVDCHLYEPHFDPMKEWLDLFYKLTDSDKDTIRTSAFLPCSGKLIIPNKHERVEDFTINSFKFENYEGRGVIKAELLT